MNDKVQVIEFKDAGPLTKIISNSNAQSILKFIADNDKCTASDIKNYLSLPASTVHYSLKALVKAKVIDNSHFSYSVKGKEITHYSLTNKLIIIVPRKKNLLSHLKAILPGLLVVGAIACFGLILRIFNLSSGSIRSYSSQFLATDTISNTTASKIIENTVNQNILSTSGCVVSHNTPWFISNNFFIGLGIGVGIIISSHFLIYFMIPKLKKYFQKHKKIPLKKNIKKRKNKTKKNKNNNHK